MVSDRKLESSVQEGPDQEGPLSNNLEKGEVTCLRKQEMHVEDLEGGESLACCSWSSEEGWMAGLEGETRGGGDELQGSEGRSCGNQGRVFRQRNARVGPSL